MCLAEYKMRFIKKRTGWETTRRGAALGRAMDRPLYLHRGSRWFPPNTCHLFMERKRALQQKLPRLSKGRSLTRSTKRLETVQRKACCGAFLSRKLASSTRRPDSCKGLHSSLRLDTKLRQNKQIARPTACKRVGFVYQDIADAPRHQTLPAPGTFAQTAPGARGQRGAR